MGTSFHAELINQATTLLHKLATEHKEEIQRVEKAAEAKLLQVADDAEIRLRKSTRNKDELEGVIIDLGIQIKNQSDIIAEQLERIQTLSAQEETSRQKKCATEKSLQVKVKECQQAEAKLKIALGYRKVCSTLEAELSIKEAENAQLVAQLARQEACGNTTRQMQLLRAAESDLAKCSKRVAELEAEGRHWQKHREILKDAYRKERQERKSAQRLLEEGLHKAGCPGAEQSDAIMKEHVDCHEDLFRSPDTFLKGSKDPGHVLFAGLENEPANGNSFEYRDTEAHCPKSPLHNGDIPGSLAETQVNHAIPLAKPCGKEDKSLSPIMRPASAHRNGAKGTQQASKSAPGTADQPRDPLPELRQPASDVQDFPQFPSPGWGLEGELSGDQKDCGSRESKGWQDIALDQASQVLQPIMTSTPLKARGISLDGSPSDDLFKRGRHGARNAKHRLAKLTTGNQRSCHYENRLSALKLGSQVEAPMQASPLVTTGEAMPTPPCRLDIITFQKAGRGAIDQSLCKQSLQAVDCTEDLAQASSKSGDTDLLESPAKPPKDAPGKPRLRKHGKQQSRSRPSKRKSPDLESSAALSDDRGYSPQINARKLLRHGCGSGRSAERQRSLEGQESAIEAVPLGSPEQKKNTQRNLGSVNVTDGAETPVLASGPGSGQASDMSAALACNRLHHSLHDAAHGESVSGGVKSPLVVEKTYKQKVMRSPRGVLETLHILDMRQGLAAESKEAFACGSTGGKQNHLPGIVEQVPPQAAAPASVGQIQAKEHKYREVVRKKSEREELQGFGCTDCEGFYRAVQSWGVEKCDIPACGHVKELSTPRKAWAKDLAQDVRQMRQQASRHRYRFEPPATPEGFWDMGFGDSQDSRC